MATMVPYFATGIFSNATTSSTAYGGVGLNYSHGVYTINLCRRNYDSVTYEGGEGTITVDVAIAPFDNTQILTDISEEYWVIRGIVLTGLNKHVEISKVYVPPGHSIFFRPNNSTGGTNSVTAQVSGIREINSLVHDVGTLTTSHTPNVSVSKLVSATFSTGIATASTATKLYLFPKWEASGDRIYYGTGSLCIFNPDLEDAFVIVYHMRQSDDEGVTVTDGRAIFVGKIPPNESVILDNILLTNSQQTGTVRSELYINCNKDVRVALNGIVVKAP